MRPEGAIGSRLGFAAHGPGIGWGRRAGRSPPTRRDRVELLARIRGSLDDAAGVPLPPRCRSAEAEARGPLRGVTNPEAPQLDRNRREAFSKAPVGGDEGNAKFLCQGYEFAVIGRRA